MEDLMDFLRNHSYHQHNSNSKAVRKLVLTPQHVQAIRWTWTLLEHEIDRVGVYSYLQLFENCPKAKEQFEIFKDIPFEELESNEVFHNHTSRVMLVIRKVVNNITEPDKFMSYLKILGQKHASYGADVAYIDGMAIIFLSGIKPILEREDAWSEESKEAWETLFGVIIQTMTQSMDEPI